jgi:PTH1 family peptidyl-tRNA hydrolase
MPTGSVRLILGLGNPGEAWEGTRHNAGFLVLDELARQLGVLFHAADALRDYEGPREFTWARTPDGAALLVKPLTFMNLSGTVLPPLLAFAGSSSAGPDAAPDASSLMVVYDDLDLPLGALRIRPKGGGGGHNGMRSIFTALGHEVFPRVRIGIGPRGTDAARHVLERFSPTERATIDATAVLAAHALREWLATGDLDRCMSRFHSRTGRGDPAHPQAGAAPEASKNASQEKPVAGHDC